MQQPKQVQVWEPLIYSNNDTSQQTQNEQSRVAFRRNGGAKAIRADMQTSRIAVPGAKMWADSPTRSSQQLMQVTPNGNQK